MRCFAGATPTKNNKKNNKNPLHGAEIYKFIYSYSGSNPEKGSHLKKLIFLNRSLRAGKIRINIK